MNHNRQWMVLVRYKDEPGAFVSRQYVTAQNPIEALAMAKAVYGNLLVPNAVFMA
jgi:hypothetical protein